MINVSTLVWQHSEAKGGALLVLLALADHAHEDGGGCYPSVAMIMKKTRLTERAVQYNLRKLERELGEITTVKPGGGRFATTYKVAVQILQGRKDCTGAAGCTSGVKPVAPQGCNGLHPNRHGTVKKPSRVEKFLSGGEKRGGMGWK